MTTKKQFAPRENKPERDAIVNRLRPSRREERQLRNDLRSRNVEHLLHELGEDSDEESE